MKKIIILFLGLSPVFAFAQINNNTFVATSTSATTSTSTPSQIATTSVPIRDKTGQIIPLDRFQTDDTGNPILFPTQVSTEEQLEVFQDNLMIIDSDIKDISNDVDMNGNVEVAVAYRHGGLMLNFLPVSYTSTTQISSNEDNINAGPIVDTTLSFWGMLVSPDQANETERVQNRISNNQVIRSNIGANATPQDIAETIDAVIWELNILESESQ